MSAARVLVAEDEQVCSLVVQRLIAKAGYDVTVVRDGVAALAALSTNQYAVLLVDWMLPGLDGIEIVRQLAAMNGTQKPRTILTSVVDIPTAREYAIAAGAVDFLPKPIAPGKLIELLRMHCANDVLEPKSATPDTTHPLSCSTAWLELGNRSVKPLSDLIGASVTADSITAHANAAGAVCFAAALVDPARGCEVFSTVVASPASALAIGKQMLGDETTQSEAEDALAEVANVVGGVVKSAFVADGFGFTLSLPSRLTTEDFDMRQARALASCTVNLRLAEHSFALSYLVRSTALIEIAAEELREGVVLAEDLKLNGAMLLPTCTRLTEGAARRAREACAGMRVKVCNPVAK